MVAVQVVLNGDVWPTALNAPFSHRASHDDSLCHIKKNLLLSLKGTLESIHFTCLWTMSCMLWLMWSITSSSGVAMCLLLMHRWRLGLRNSAKWASGRVCMMHCGEIRICWPVLTDSSPVLLTRPETSLLYVLFHSDKVVTVSFSNHQSGTMFGSCTDAF